MLRICRGVFVLFAFSVDVFASATNYTLWINGRTGGGQIGNYDSFTYWGPASTAAGARLSWGPLGRGDKPRRNLRNSSLHDAA